MTPVCQLRGSTGGGLRKGLMASAHPNGRHFSLSQYATGALVVATPVLELKGSESQLMSLCVGSLRETAWGFSSFSH